MAVKASDLVAKLVVNGQEYTRWKGIKVQRDWHTVPSVFTFVCAEPGPYGKGYQALRLKPGDAAQVFLGGVLAATCYITTRTAAYDAESHDLIVSGKSITCDMVDSSVKIQPGTFNGQTFEQAARSVLKPHNINLVLRNPPAALSKPFKSLVPQYGETVFEFIARMGAMRGVDMTDDAAGNLIVGQGNPSAAPVAQLEEGRNIKSCRSTLADETAWSRLTITGQNTAQDDADWPPRDHSATVQNPYARPNRILNLQAEHPGDSQDMQSRANHEVARANWPQVNVTVTVFGWKRDDGKLWDVTDNVSIYSPMAFPDIDGPVTLGIQSVIFSQDDKSGTTTILELVKREALYTNGDLNTPAAGGSGNPVNAPIPDQAQPDAPDMT